MTRRRSNQPRLYRATDEFPRPDLISWRERQRRMQGQETEAWDRSGKAASDPGLREVYSDIARLPIRLIACPLKKDVNHGGLLRLAEAFRLEHVSLAPEVDGAVDGAGHRGSRDLQPHRWEPAPIAIERAQADGYRIYGVTLSEDAVSVNDLEWEFPCALVLGSELDGLPQEISRVCDARIAIPLYGLITSLNVTTAAGIVVHHAVTQYAAAHPGCTPVRRESRALLGLPPVDYRSVAQEPGELGNVASPADQAPDDSPLI